MMELFYAGILPIRVSEEVGEELLIGVPFEGCRTYDMYTPFDHCPISASYEVVAQMRGTDTYSDVILPMMLRELTDKGGYYSQTLDWDIMHKLKYKATRLEKLVLYLWLTAYVTEQPEPDSVSQGLALYRLSNWVAPRNWAAPIT